MDESGTIRRSVGDLGRRIAFRRNELALSRQQVAALTGMAPEYLYYIEHYPANVAAESLLRLAVALRTTVDELLGVAVEHRPDGRAQEGRRNRFARIEAGDCMRLLAAGGVGRVVMTTEDGPVAIPVNFAIYEGAVMFRTVKDGVVARHLGHLVGFEVDRLDEALTQGWSVLVSGRARRIANPAIVARVRERVEPWAEGERDLYVSIDPATITGRRITR